MNKFKFFLCNASKKIVGQARGHFNELKLLPPEFTEDDIKNCLGYENFFSDRQILRLSKMRTGSSITLTKICGWSGASGGAEYLLLVCITDNEINQLRKEEQRLKTEKERINKEIYKLAGPLIDDLKVQQSALDKISKKISKYNSTGEL
jgi:hypothetical protein